MGMFNKSISCHVLGHHGDITLEVFPSSNGRYSSVGLDVKEFLPRKRGRAVAKRLWIRCPLDPETAMTLGSLLTQWGREMKEARDAEGS